MPLCTACREFLPPDLCIEIADGVHKCIFCHRGIVEVTMTDGSVISKHFAIHDYKEFIKRVVDRQEYKDIVVESAVRKTIKQ